MTCDERSAFVSNAELEVEVTRGATLRYPLMQHSDGSCSDSGLVRSLGLVARSFATIQIDLNVVHTNPMGSEITLCDHNCTVAVGGVPSGGNYTCPAAISLNRGARRTTLAPAHKLTKGLGVTIAGLDEAQRLFLRDDLNAYFSREGIPVYLHEEFRAALSARGVVVNLFGGSPETHPQIIDIIESLHDQGAEVHMTTTGRRLLRDIKFRNQRLSHPPDLIGLSADDFKTTEDLDHLFGCPTNSCRTYGAAYRGSMVNAVRPSKRYKFASSQSGWNFHRCCSTLCCIQGTSRLSRNYMTGSHVTYRMPYSTRTQYRPPF